MKKMLLTVDSRHVGEVLTICKPYLHRTTLRRKNTRKVFVEIEAGLLSRIGIRYEMWRAKIRIR